MASNYPRIWKEIERIKHVIRVFNISRSNLKNFNDKIKNQLSIEDLTKGTIKDNIRIGSTKTEDTLPKEDSPTAKRLKKKFTYSRSEFRKMRIDTFKSESVQKVFEEWEANNHMVITKEANEVLENIKMQKPKIMSWDNYKLINCLSEHWSDRKNIEEKLTDEAIKRVKTIDLKERESDDTRKFR